MIRVRLRMRAFLVKLFTMNTTNTTGRSCTTDRWRLSMPVPTFFINFQKSIGMPFRHNYSNLIAPTPLAHCHASFHPNLALITTPPYKTHHNRDRILSNVTSVCDIVYPADDDGLDGSCDVWYETMRAPGRSASPVWQMIPM